MFSRKADKAKKEEENKKAEEEKMKKEAEANNINRSTVSKKNLNIIQN